MVSLPGSVLFACTMNSVRSPIAESILKHLLGHRIYVDSVGVRSREIDGFAIAVMEELGIDLARHRPKTFDDLEDESFDLIVTFSPEAQHRAIELTRTMACDVEYWRIMDPTLFDGDREAMLETFRQARDAIVERIKARFQMPLKP